MVKTNKHIYNGGMSTGNINILMGDLNSNFREKGKGGCHKGTVTWSEENGWLNRAHELADQLTIPLATHCTKNGPDSWIDHILIHDTSNRAEQTAVATSEGSFWATVSDHRPLVSDFKTITTKAQTKTATT
jgi:endonuclease/exonuclease/phosphatase family metal-dependent hydrolase